MSLGPEVGSWIVCMNDFTNSLIRERTEMGTLIPGEERILHRSQIHEEVQGIQRSREKSHVGLWVKQSPSVAVAAGVATRLTIMQLGLKRQSVLGLMVSTCDRFSLIMLANHWMVQVTPRCVKGSPQYIIHLSKGDLDLAHSHALYRLRDSGCSLSVCYETVGCAYHVCLSVLVLLCFQRSQVLNAPSPNPVGVVADWRAQRGMTDLVVRFFVLLPV